MIFTIDKDTCTYCGLCAEDCPQNIITIDESSETAVISTKGCIECGHCAMVCPTGSIMADGKELPPYPETHGPAAELFEHLILSKRSIRKYSGKEPGRKDLEAIMLAGQLTATATNSRQVDSVIIQGPAVQETAVTIAKIIQKVLILVNNPIGRNIARIAGFKQYAKSELLVNYYDEMAKIVDGESDILFFNAPAVVILTYAAKNKMFGRTDCALAGQNMMLTAHNRGIGSCMIGFAEAALWNKRLRKKIGVSPDRRIGLIFTLGHTELQYHRYPTRKVWEL